MSKTEINKLAYMDLKSFDNFIKNADIDNLKKIKDILDDLYYNTGDSNFPDYRYDMIKDFLEKNNNYTPKVGAKLRDGENRVKLPFWLGSADKITHDDPKELTKWIKNNPSESYIISEKLDGISCLLVYENNSLKLYTRGDGEIGADISYLASYFKIPKLTNDISVRGELIISKKTFQNKYENKSTENKIYKNARNMVSGLISGKTARQALEDIKFVVYEIVGDDTMLPPIKQLKKLEKIGFKIVKYEEIFELDIEILLNKLIEFKNESKFEIDGIIVQSNQEYERNTNGNPDYMFAYKARLEGSIIDTKVLDVEWNVSRWGKITPVVIIETVRIDGVEINRASAFHASFVVKNKIGPGTIVSIIRSGQVIPHILKVVKGTTPKLPNVPYVWDKSGIAIYTKKFDNTICVKLISKFFSDLGIKYVSEATVSKMFDNGLNNLFKILEADKNRLLQINTFEKKSVDRIYDNIHNGLKNVKKTTLIGASSVLGYGIGVRKVEALFSAIPDILEIYPNHTKKDFYKYITSVDGFSNKSADKIYPNLKYAAKFIKKMKKYASFKSEEKISDSLKGEKIVMTGFRDAEMKEAIELRGGKVTTTVTSKTTIVITSGKTDTLTGKLLKAQELGTKIYSKEKFKKEFL